MLTRSWTAQDMGCTLRNLKRKFQNGSFEAFKAHPSGALSALSNQCHSLHTMNINDIKTISGQLSLKGKPTLVVFIVFPVTLHL